MPNESSKMKSWQIFHFFRKQIGREVLYSIFGTKNSRTVDYWSQDPIFTGKPEGAFDPIKGIKEMIDRLDNYGHVGVAQACIDYLCAGTSLDCGREPHITEPKKSLMEEILADYRSVAELQRAVEEGASPAFVAKMRDAAIEEIERTYARYVREYGSDHAIVPEN